MTPHLERKAVKLADFEIWRLALEEGGRASAATTKRIRKLERERRTAASSPWVPD